MSERVQIIGLLLAFCSTVFTGVMAYLMARLNDKQDSAAVKTEQVKETLEKNQVCLDEKLELATRERGELVKVSRDTHMLVNSQRGATLRALALALRNIAEVRPSADNLAAASKAERDCMDHETEQAKVDAGANG
jgi:hypothetical protein